MSLGLRSSEKIHSGGMLKGILYDCMKDLLSDEVWLQPKVGMGILVDE